MKQGSGYRLYTFFSSALHCAAGTHTCENFSAGAHPPKHGRQVTAPGPHRCTLHRFMSSRRSNQHWVTPSHRHTCGATAFTCPPAVQHTLACCQGPAPTQHPPAAVTRGDPPHTTPGAALLPQRLTCPPRANAARNTCCCAAQHTTPGAHSHTHTHCRLSKTVRLRCCGGAAAGRPQHRSPPTRPRHKRGTPGACADLNTGVGGDDGNQSSHRPPTPCSTVGGTVETQRQHTWGGWVAVWRSEGGQAQLACTWSGEQSLGCCAPGGVA